MANQNQPSKYITKSLLLILSLFTITMMAHTTAIHAASEPTPLTIHLKTVHHEPKTGTVTIIDKTNHIHKTYHHAKVRILSARTGSDGVTGSDFIIITSSRQRIRPSMTAQVTYTPGATYNSEINGIGER